MKNRGITGKGMEEFEYPRFEGKNHVILKQRSFGINYDDLNVKNGTIRNPNPYNILGIEACGVVEEVSSNCERGFKRGDIVSYATYKPGAFVEYRSINENYLIPVPSYISFNIACTILKGLMAYTLLGKIFVLEKGSTIILTGASGAIGSIVSQLASKGKMKVIALTSTEEKKTYLESNGALLSINYKKQNVTDEVMKFTNGKGADCLFDCLGRDSEPFAFEALKSRGFFIQYGTITGVSAGLSLERMKSKSIVSTRVVMGNFVTNYNDFISCAFAYEKSIQSGIIVPKVSAYKFGDFERAFSDIKLGKTIGQKVLSIF